MAGRNLHLLFRQMPVKFAAEATYRCPMHPEAEQQGARSCPKCGMALENRTLVLDEEENPRCGQN